MPAKPPYLLLSVIIVNLYLFGCQRPDQSLKHLQTKQIDTSVYKQLNKRFDVFMTIPPDHLGGLTPDYPIATCIQLIYGDDYKLLTKDTDWMTGGLTTQLRKIVVKGPKGFTLINNRLDLQKMYAPITTKEEALAYAILYCDGFAVFEDFYKKKKYRFVDKPVVSDVIKTDNFYIVTVFTYAAFGCHHPYYRETIRVNEDGRADLLTSVEAFYDPADDGLCAD
nr:hypothetical protein [uncultured Mucilaginibacter sp.]